VRMHGKCVCMQKRQEVGVALTFVHCQFRVQQGKAYELASTLLTKHGIPVKKRKTLHRSTGDVKCVRLLFICCHWLSNMIIFGVSFDAP